MKLLNPFTAGALCDSSSYLAKGMCDAVIANGIDKHIIELGPGNGVFTRGLSRINKVTAVELNSNFEGVLKPYADVIIDDVFHYLDICGIQENAIFVSGLPHIMFGREVFRQLICSIRKNMVSGSHLVLFTYWRWAIERWSEGLGFEVESTKYIFLNIPPAWVMTLKAV
jgi:phospholipid N-methyltransferase